MKLKNKIQTLVVVMTVVDSWKTSPRVTLGCIFA
jgi:hypothetical protein